MSYSLLNTRAHSNLKNQSTAKFAGLKDFDAYSRLYAPGADVESTSDDFYAEVNVEVAGSLVFTHRLLRNAAHSRDLERVKRNAFDHFTLGFIHSGEMELYTERGRHTIRDGCVVLMDMTRPARHLSSVEITTVSLPRILVPESVRTSGRLHGLVLSGRDAEPLKRWLNDRSYSPPSESALSTALVAALRPAGDDRDVALSRNQLDRARDFIEATIADLALSPERLAQALGMSRATLYRAFEPLGSIGRWRQGRRLLRFKAALAFTDLSIAEASCWSGLEHPAHASTLFSKSYGLSPSLFRRRAAEMSVDIDSDPDLTWVLENIATLTSRSMVDGTYDCE